jgi:hypothetical protein
MVGLHVRIEAGPTDVRQIPYTEWYRSALLSSTTPHSRLIRAGEQAAEAGPTNVAAELTTASERLVEQLHRTNEDFLIPLASIPGSGVPITDFVRTRLVEITVHGYDIASSVGLRWPDFDPLAWKVASEVVAETTGLNGSGATFVLDATRPTPQP